MNFHVNDLSPISLNLEFPVGSCDDLRAELERLEDRLSSDSFLNRVPNGIENLLMTFEGRCRWFETSTHHLETESDKISSIYPEYPGEKSSFDAPAS